MPSKTPGPRRHPADLIAAASVFTGTAVVDMVGRPDMDAAGHRLHGVAAYALTTCLVALSLGAVALARHLRTVQSDRSRPGLAFGLVTAAAVGFSICAAGSLATGDSRFGGLVYPLSMLASVLGLAMLATGAARAQALPTWLAAAVPLGWLAGGPVAEGQLFRGATLISAAVALALIATPTRELHASSPTRTTAAQA